MTDHGFCPFMSPRKPNELTACGKGCALFIDDGENWQGCSFKALAWQEVRSG